MNNKSQYPTISVVVPIYNVEKFLHKCIDSILSQTYSDLEVILVNDGSPDSCPEICEEYKLSDQRITVLHKVNGGLSSARNTGLESSTSDLILFIDSDDWIEPEFVQTLYDTLVDNDADISVCSYYKDYEDQHSLPVGDSGQTKVLTKEDALIDLLTSKKFGSVMAWNKLYKSALFKENNVRYPEGKIHEDKFTTYKLYSDSNKIVYIDTPLYHYLQRDGSIMNQSFNRKRLAAVEASDQTVEFFQDSQPELRDAAAYNSITTNFILLDSLYKMARSTDYAEYVEIENILRTSLKSNLQQSLQNPYMRAVDKIRLYLAVRLNPLYKILSRVR